MSAPATTPARPSGQHGALRRVRIALALAVGLTSLGVLASPMSVAAWDPGVPDAASEATLISLTNQSRASAGMRTLTVDPALVAFALERSEDMAIRGFFGHDIPPKGTKVFDTMTAAGYCYEVAGENIGWLGGGDDDAEARIQQMFLDSPTHRAVLMGGAWDVMGIGSYKRADGRKFWTVLFADSCDRASAPPLARSPAGPNGMRVVDSAPAGLFDTLVGGITGLFLGS